jgi:hypothetical protein
MSNERRAAIHEQRSAYAARHTASSSDGPLFEALYDADCRVVKVSPVGPDGRRTVTVYDDWAGSGELRTDSVGDLAIGAGRWLKLGNCTTRTATSRVARHLAGH